MASAPFKAATSPSSSPSPLATLTHHVHSYSTQSSTPPDNNTSTPKNASPSSPRSMWGVAPHVHLQAKQLRSPRSPLYVPAVLRPTEIPTKHSPPKGEGFGSIDSHSREAQSSIQEPESLLPTAGLRRLVTEEWNESMAINVTGPPSRNHWKPDPSSPKCDSPICDRPFTLFTRRHHCRRCGNIFCAEHSPYTIPLDQHARFHQLAPKFRSCEDCFRDYQVWEAGRNRKDTDDSRERASSAGETANGIDINVRKKAETGGLINTLAQSVPRDWSWSTF